MPHMHQAVILLGSNIDPAANIRSAIRLLQDKLAVHAVSTVWETLPVGSPGPNFYNAAIRASTSLPADRLVSDILRPIEAALGRTRTADKNAARTIDLDLVLFDQTLLEPNLWVQSFITVPVSEVLPRLKNPATGRSLKEAAREFLASQPFISHPEVLGMPD